MIYTYAYLDWTFLIEDLNYNKKNIVHMKNKHFPGMKYSFPLSRKETSVHDIGINVIGNGYKRIDEALLYFKLQLIGEK